MDLKAARAERNTDQADRSGLQSVSSSWRSLLLCSVGRQMVVGKGEDAVSCIEMLVRLSELAVNHASTSLTCSDFVANHYLHSEWHALGLRWYNRLASRRMRTGLEPDKAGHAASRVRMVWLQMCQ